MLWRRGEVDGHRNLSLEASPPRIFQVTTEREWKDCLFLLPHWKTMDEFLRTFLPKRTRKEATFPFRKMFLRIHACILLGFLFCPFLFDFFLLLRPVHFSSLRPCSKRKAKRNAPTNQPSDQTGGRKMDFSFFFALWGERRGGGGIQIHLRGENPPCRSPIKAYPFHQRHPNVIISIIKPQISERRKREYQNFLGGEETVFRGKTGNRLRHKG